MSSSATDVVEHPIETPIKKKRVHIMTPARIVAFKKAQEARKLKLEERRQLKKEQNTRED
jgi:hypothetical protein